MVMVLADKDTKIITLEYKGGHVHVSAQNDSGEAEASFPADGDNFQTFAVNGRFLKDALGTMTDVVMGLTGIMNPILLSEGDNQQVIMPMALRK